MTDTPTVNSERLKGDLGGLLLDMAAKLIACAEEAGFNLTIELRPNLPLAMGNHRPVVTIYPRRNS